MLLEMMYRGVNCSEPELRDPMFLVEVLVIGDKYEVREVWDHAIDCLKSALGYAEKFGNCDDDFTLHKVADLLYKIVDLTPIDEHRLWSVVFPFVQTDVHELLKLE